jgi:small subunit ribosomal protein S16
MVKIRLSRLGSKGKIFYRIVAADEKRKRSGKFLEILGYWHPQTQKAELNKERIKHWVERGAIVTKAVEKLSK